MSIDDFSVQLQSSLSGGGVGKKHAGSTRTGPQEEELIQRRQQRYRREHTHANVRKSICCVASRAFVLVAALCLRASTLVDKAEAIGMGGGPPTVGLHTQKSWTAETTEGLSGKKPGRLQRSRSESALAMLERKLSEQNLQDPKCTVPGERVLTFSELFAKLSRPEMLEGVRPAYVQGAANENDGKKNQKAQKLVVVLVGLPARGKSYISHRLVNYMNWFGVRCRLFNVGAFRRQKVEQNKGSHANFFDSDNKDAANQREELASAVLEQLLEWLKHGKGNMMAIFDATNTTKERRRRVVERAMKEAGVSVLFVESICTDQKVIEANLVEKVRLSPDFKGMDFHAAIKDLKSRVANYEAIYETMSETEHMPGLGVTQSVSFIKVCAKLCRGCCSVLQCVVVCCSVLQCVVVWCSVTQSVSFMKVCAKFMSFVLQCVAVWCSVTQSVLLIKVCAKFMSLVLQCVAVCCSVLQCVAVCCSVV